MKTETFYIARSNVTGGFRITQTVPELFIDQKARTVWTNADLIAEIYKLDEIVPILDIPCGALWKVDVSKTSNDTVEIRVIDRFVAHKSFCR